MNRERQIIGTFNEAEEDPTVFGRSFFPDELIMAAAVVAASLPGGESLPWSSEESLCRAAYAKQELRKVKAIAKATVRVLKKAGHAIARAAKAVAKAAYKYSGAADVVSCVTHPALASCAKAALTVALVAATGGEGEAEVAALDAAENVGTGTAEHVAEGAGESTVKDAADSCVVRGGQSFTPATLVLLASGRAVPISSLRVGDLVLATNTKTGKTQPEAVTAVLVHHDTDVYDLRIRAGTRTAVIDTTSGHLFWVPAGHGNAGRWVKAGALRYGTHLRTPSGAYATVTGGWTPPPAHRLDVGPHHPRQQRPRLLHQHHRSQCPRPQLRRDGI